jgi:hypothetical protein
VTPSHRATLGLHSLTRFFRLLWDMSAAKHVHARAPPLDRTPQCREVPTLARLLRAGVTCARVDLSWGTKEYHAGSLANLAEAMRQTRLLCRWGGQPGRLETGFEPAGGRVVCVGRDCGHATNRVSQLWAWAAARPRLLPAAAVTRAIGGPPNH